MKRLIPLLLALLLLCGCVSDPVSTETAAATAAPTTAVPTTEALPLSELSELTEGAILFYREEHFQARQGQLLSMEAVLSAPAEQLLPRAHSYDSYFPDELGIWLQLLDYTLGQGYQGFSVPAGTLPDIGADQRRAMELVYRIDSGKVLSTDADGVTTVWFKYRKDRSDVMARFAEGLTAARAIAAQAPRGDEWETVGWIYDYLTEHIEYGDRDTYYLYHGYHIYDALVEGVCVCSGYADAMYYLCNLCGVECLTVCGNCISDHVPGGIDGHAWNLARVDGVWYCFDPTADDVDGMPELTTCFGLSAEVLSLMGKYQLTGTYADEGLLPACESCFKPAAVWNTTPEGALKSWLWYAQRTETVPAYLLFCSGLVTTESTLVEQEDGTGATNLPYREFLDWSLGFMTEDCAAAYLPAYFFKTEDGMLGLQPRREQSAIDWKTVEIRSVSAGADGAYSADLGGASAVFTVRQGEDGLWRIDAMNLTPKE